MANTLEQILKKLPNPMSLREGSVFDASPSNVVAIHPTRATSEPKTSHFVIMAAERRCAKRQQMIIIAHNEENKFA